MNLFPWPSLPLLFLVDEFDLDSDSALTIELYSNSIIWSCSEDTYDKVIIKADVIFLALLLNLIIDYIGLRHISILIYHISHPLNLLQIHILRTFFEDHPRTYFSPIFREGVTLSIFVSISEASQLLRFKVIVLCIFIGKKTF